MKPESATVKPEAMVSSTPIALAAGSAIAVTPEESSAGVESVTIVCARVDKSVNRRLVANIPIYVKALALFVDSTQSSGLRMRTVAM